METWRLEETDNGLRLKQEDKRREKGSERFTWAELLYGKLALVKVYAIYFPSRFDLPVDNQAMDALKVFGKNTGPDTSVNFWDTTDPEFIKALELFKLNTIPALVLARGLKFNNMVPQGPTKADLYTIVIADTDLLSKSERLAYAVNAAHQILIGSNPQEISNYIHTQNAKALLESIGKIASSLLKEIRKFKLTFQLPGGVSLQLG